MLRSLCLILFVFLLPGAAALAQHQAFSPIDRGSVIVCPVQVGETTPPDFTAPDCRAVQDHQINPQGKMIWIRASFHLDQTHGPNGEPLALYVSGKMSSQIFLNGVLVGRNGIPGADRAGEVPGLMDATLFAPQELFQEGENEIILRASAQHGLLDLRHPVHFIGAGVAGNRSLDILAHYWPSLLTLGVFILGCLYFGTIGLFGVQRRTALTFAAICGFAAAQLVTEVSRGLVAYAYSFHDVRLILITVFSACFGLSVTYHIVSSLMARRVHWIMLGACALSLAGAVLPGGFDYKAAYSMLLPLALSLLIAGYYSFQRAPRAFGYFLMLLIFVTAIFSYPGMFLDVIFFYLVALFLLMLLVEQGVMFAREQALRRVEQARANRLELALEQVRQRDEASEVSVKSAGRMERISTADIVQCRGAGGYSEIILADGRELLHSATLAEMEESLPATFIRVHRSHLVNTTYVRTLNRDPSGTGALVLSDGSEVAVSRRIMPTVRQVLA